MPSYLWKAIGIPDPIEEYRFHPKRLWRFDYAWPLQKIALEVEGGVWTQGRHTRGVGFLKDMEKYNAAGLLGWRIFRFTPDQFNDSRGLVHLFIKEVFDKSLSIGNEC